MAEDMSWTIVLVAFFLIIPIYCGHCEEPTAPAFCVTMAAATAEGRAEYEKMVANSLMPKYGECWRKAIESLRADCQELTDDIHMLMALNFADCFLKNSGLAPVGCEKDETVAECVAAAKVQPIFQTAYMQFFTHTENICFFLSQQQQHNATSSQIPIPNSQQHGINNEEVPNDNLNASDSEVVQVVSEKLDNSIEESEGLLSVASIGERITRLQSFFIDSLLLRERFYFFVFYLISFGLCFISTTTKRTPGARLGLLRLLAVILLIELLYRMIRVAAVEHEPLDCCAFASILDNETWLIRWSFWIVAVPVIGLHIFRYKDGRVENTQPIIPPNAENCLCGPSLSSSSDVSNEKPIVPLRESSVDPQRHGTTPSSSLYMNGIGSGGGLLGHVTESDEGKILSQSSRQSVDRQRGTPIRNDHGNREGTPVQLDVKENSHTRRSATPLSTTVSRRVLRATPEGSNAGVPLVNGTGKHVAPLVEENGCED